MKTIQKFGLYELKWRLYKQPLFQDSEDSSSIPFFCTGIPLRSGFIFGPQNSNQDSCRNSGFLLHVGISTSVPGFYSGGLPISTICPRQMGSKVGLLVGQLVGRALI